MACAHQHRRLWIIAGGAWLWCYECGAIRLNAAGPKRWHVPTGPNGENPAMHWNYCDKSPTNRHQFRSRKDGGVVGWMCRHCEVGRGSVRVWRKTRAA